jgi:radial spoke head protein 4A
VGSEWTELPLVTPQQLRSSRLIKYVFSGDLNKKVVSSPPFDGQEKHLLKAQLVRITHNCEIVPKGLYAPLEENPDEVDFAEEFKMPDFAEQANLENWVHFNPYILKQGRATYFVDPKIPEDQKEEYLAKLG